MTAAIEQFCPQSGQGKSFGLTVKGATGCGGVESAIHACVGGGATLVQETVCPGCGKRSLQRWHLVSPSRFIRPQLVHLLASMIVRGQNSKLKVPAINEAAMRLALSQPFLSILPRPRR